jgi:hypothetical protein
MSKLLPKLYATLRVIECTDVDKTVEEMKEDLCVKVSGQKHWHEMTDDQKHAVLRMAIQKKNYALDHSIMTVKLKKLVNIS